MGQFTIAIITFLITSVITTVIYKIFNFNYNYTQDGIKDLRFIIDLGLWIVIFLPVFILLENKFGKKKNDGEKNAK